LRPFRALADERPFECAGSLQTIRCISLTCVSKDAEDRSVAVQVHQALLPSVKLELFPKSSIDVFITILENDGIESCTATAAVAASTALADAGIEMLGLVMACTAVGSCFYLSFSSARLIVGSAQLAQSYGWILPNRRRPLAQDR
jgi:hypothetical protein